MSTQDNRNQHLLEQFRERYGDEIHSARLAEDVHGLRIEAFCEPEQRFTLRSYRGIPVVRSVLEAGEEDVLAAPVVAGTDETDPDEA